MMWEALSKCMLRIPLPELCSFCCVLFLCNLHIDSNTGGSTHGVVKQDLPKFISLVVRQFTQPYFQHFITKYFSLKFKTVFRANDKNRNSALMLCSGCSFCLLSCLTYDCVCILYCSVWDALTDNYISTWDGADSEGLNGNISDPEVHTTLSLFLFMVWIWEM